MSEALAGDIGTSRSRSRGFVRLGRPRENRGGRMVGAAGFEPTTPTPPVWCATRLRYAPTRRTIGAHDGANHVGTRQNSRTAVHPSPARPTDGKPGSGNDADQLAPPPLQPLEPRMAPGPAPNPEP